MMKMRRWGLFLALSFSLVMLNSSVLAGNISEPYPVQFLSFIQYHVVETNWDEDIYTRTIRGLKPNGTKTYAKDWMIPFQPWPN